MNGSSRSIAIKKNIIASLFLKGISILVSLQVVPLTINYINPTRYGFCQNIDTDKAKYLP